MRPATRRQSGRRDLLRLGTLRALGDLEAHPLVLVQAAVSGGLDRGVVDEHIRAPAVRRDEPESLFRVEPLDGSLSHCCISSTHTYRPTTVSGRVAVGQVGARPTVTLPAGAHQKRTRNYDCNADTLLRFPRASASTRRSASGSRYRPA